MHFLVNSSKENIHNELVAALYREELIDDLLSENPSVAARRKECKQVLDVLRKANEILNEVCLCFFFYLSLTALFLVIKIRKKIRCVILL